jgi:hypothetical protein
MSNDTPMEQLARARFALSEIALIVGRLKGRALSGQDVDASVFEGALRDLERASKRVRGLTEKCKQAA